MLDDVAETPTPADPYAAPADAAQLDAAQRAEQFLGGGIPLTLTTAAGARYARHCQELIDELDARDSPISMKLAAAQIIATAALRSAQCDLDSAVAAAADLGQRASRSGDEVARAYALASWGMAHPAPEHADRRAAAAHDLLEVAVRCGEGALVPIGYALLLVALLEQGMIRSIDIALLEQRAESALLRDRPHENPAVWFRCLRLLLDGAVAEAEEQAQWLLERSPRTGTVAGAVYATQLGMVRWMQGRLDGAEDGFLASRRDYPEQLLWSASLAWLWTLQGRRSSAEAMLNSLPPLAEIPRDRYWLATITVLAEIARSGGSRENAQLLRGILLPFAAHLVQVGVGVSFWGTAARALGLLEERLGMIEEARTHLELAVELCEGIGALAWHAEAQIELAEFGIRHELVDIPAYDLLAEARRTSEARGFAALAQRAMHRPRISVLGRFEVVAPCGTRATWTSRKARELLKMLVAARGAAASREVYMDRLWPDEDPASLGNRFSVAVNVIRRALDPGRLFPTQRCVVTEGNSIRLEVEQLDIDLDRFLLLAERQDVASRLAARRLYRGPAFAEEPYADWAVGVREQAAHAHRLLA